MVDSYVAAAGAAAHDVSAVTVLAVSSHFDRCFQVGIWKKK